MFGVSISSTVIPHSTHFHSTSLSSAAVVNVLVIKSDPGNAVLN